MNLLLRLLCIINTVQSSSVVENDKVSPQLPLTPAMPKQEFFLVEPSSNNDILAKFNFDFYAVNSGTESVSEITKEVVATVFEETSSFIQGTVYTYSVYSITSTTDAITNTVESLVTLKNFKLSEIKDACCTSGSIVVSFVKPEIKQTAEFAYLILSPKGNFKQSIPHTFAATFSNSNGIEQKIVCHNKQIIYKIPLKEIEKLCITIFDLGIANAGDFKKTPSGGLELVLESDIFSDGPFIGSVENFSCKYSVPSPYKLPDNTSINLEALHREFKETAKIGSVTPLDLTKMAIATFINEIRTLFTCPKPALPECNEVPKVTCNKIISEYFVFVSSVVRVIAFIEQKEKVDCSFTVSSEGDKYSQLCNCVNSYASNCQISNVELNTEITCLFSNVIPTLEYKSFSVQVLTAVKIQVGEEQESSSDENVKEQKKEVARKKLSAKVKSQTGISGYGWYVAGGLVAISTSVIVYIFVL